MTSDSELEDGEPCRNLLDVCLEVGRRWGPRDGMKRGAVSAVV